VRGLVTLKSCRSDVQNRTALCSGWKARATASPTQRFLVLVLVLVPRTPYPTLCVFLRVFASSRETTPRQHRPPSPLRQSPGIPGAEGRSRAGKPELRRAPPRDSSCYCSCSNAEHRTPLFAASRLRVRPTPCNAPQRLAAISWHPSRRGQISGWKARATERITRDSRPQLAKLSAVHAILPSPP